MSEELTEQEQIEALKKWWSEYGTSIFIGLIIGISALIGVRYWLKYQQTHAQAASDAYNSFVVAAAKKDDAVTTQLAKNMLKNYKGTSYAALTALRMAKRDVDAGKLVDAESQLRWAMGNPGHDVIGLIARQRLAQVLIAENKLDAALKILSKVKDQTFDPLYAELRGDIYSKQGNIQQARDSYQLALNDKTLAGEDRKFLLMKLQALPQKQTDTKKK